MVVDPSTTKYLIRATVNADGVVEKPDIIGAVFGQTEGLLGNELDLRDLQKSARIGRVEVDIETRNGKTTGTIILPSALDKVESAILAAGLETIDRIGPAKALIRVTSIEDTREARRKSVVDRAKELLSTINEGSGQDSSKIADEVRSAVQVAEVTKFRNTKLPAGPNVDSSDSVILVEGRNDVINLLKCGIKNAVAVEGTNIPDEIKELSKEKTTIVFVDGDRGGELIAKEILQTCEVDFVARAPPTREVEELPHKLVMKCLKNKVTAEQFTSQMGIVLRKPEGAKGEARAERSEEPRQERGERPERRDERQGGREGGRDGAREGGRDGGRGERPAREERQEREPREGGDDRRGRGGRGRGGRGRRDDAEGEEQAAEPGEAAPVAVREGDPRTQFKQILGTLSGSLKAVLLDDTGKTLQGELAVRELADTLKGSKDGVHAVVFDGVITQRLLDIAAEKKIATVVGVKMGNVTKVPDTVEILTRDDLQ
ncbi:MAG TPA: DNA primase DnaG [Candidatus Thermoplasmatota archaeon]|nr:DNA primase DnaG [Candidatus Thermoplasmatota archaeon]